MTDEKLLSPMENSYTTETLHKHVYKKRLAFKPSALPGIGAQSYFYYAQKEIVEFNTSDSTSCEHSVFDLADYCQTIWQDYYMSLQQLSKSQQEHRKKDVRKQEEDVDNNAIKLTIVTFVLFCFCIRIAGHVREIKSVAL